MNRTVRVETLNGNVITGLYHGTSRIQIRGVTKVCRVVGWQYISIDNISVSEYVGEE